MRPQNVTEYRYRLWSKTEPSLLSRYDRWRRMADELRLSRKARLKLEWFIHYYQKASEKALVTCRYFGISKSVFYKWFSVFDESNLMALEEGSRAPQKRRGIQITQQEQQRILILRKNHSEFGKMKLRVLYHLHHGQTISSWKIQRVIERYHLQRKQKRVFRKNSVSKRKTIELKREEKSGFLVAFDTIVIHRNGTKRYIVTGIDTVSKLAWARMYSSHSSATTRDLFIRLYTIIHGNILNACHDNGSEFEKHFARLLTSLKIPEYFSRVKTPKDNPVCERFNRTFKQEFLRMGNYTSDLHEFNRRLTSWLLKYNCYRPHQTLGYMTPFQYHFPQSVWKFSEPVLSTM